MAKSILTRPYFSDEAAAFAELESIVWQNGPVCPKCGATDRIGALEGVEDKKGRVRHGLKKCYHCRKQFTVRVGTVFEASHVPLHLWLQAAFLMCSSKKGISSNQLHRTLGVTLKTAWFMSHRLREAMADGFFAAPMGGDGKAVEADETFWGQEHKKAEGARGYHHKMKIFSLVERKGKVRSFHVPAVNEKTLLPIMKEQIAADTNLMTDEAFQYNRVKGHFPKHESVNHRSGEYVRGAIHTNTVEGYFSILKRGLYGTYQNVSAKHLRRYIGEFDLRYNNRIALGVDDAQRTESALRGIVGKRLTYRDSSWA
jgi:transposase-like protein